VTSKPTTPFGRLKLEVPIWHLKRVAAATTLRHTRDRNHKAAFTRLLP
jgi:hypothetical protein